ncbi:MAG: hypothetical protein ABW096_19030 [Candidatus Thiodiazotropha sp.]
MSIELQFLPARQGDAIWIRWPEGDRTRQILIDMGTEEIGHAIRGRLEELPEAGRVFDLLVVTHVDRDHIGGVLTCLAEADERLAGLKFNDVWFNGWEHLDGGKVPPPANSGTLEGMGPAQGERLAHWLREQPWNQAFDRGPVVRGSSLLTKRFGDLSLTIMGPTQDRLKNFKPVWKEEVEIALEKGRLEHVSPGLESYGPKVPPILESREDLEELADERIKRDTSRANGSSIALLLEWKGRRVLLSGDAYADDILQALKDLPGDQPVKLDAFKLPHHGSKKNLHDELVKAVDCPRFIFSTDGTQFRHPDPVAIARVIRSSVREKPCLCFNVRSKYNGWWDNPEWIDAFNYQVEYGDDEQGCTLSLESASS